MEQLELFKREVYPWVTLEQRCQALVIALVGSKAQTWWWQGYNKAFGCTPEQQMQYNPMTVYKYLMSNANGAYY